jgi:tricorn protease
MPIPARNYEELKPGKEGVLFVVEGPLVQPLNGPSTSTVYRFELKTRKTDKLLENILAFHVSADGEKLLYRNASAPQPGATAPAQMWVIAPLPPAPTSGSAGTSGPLQGAKTLNLTAMDVRIEPALEWKAMYNEAFRLERDFFYEPGFHGLDLAATEKKYAAYLPGVASRDDLNYIFRETMGELTVGHLFVRGGDGPETKRIPVGLLGAD